MQVWEKGVGMCKTIAIITARGGSKRIPKKNIKLFCGQPIIVYSIKAALEAGCFDEVMVSTDSEQIADIAKKTGARVPFFRSAENSNDFTTTYDVIKEVFETYREQGEHFEQYCCIYPTAPFITPKKLNDAMQLLKEENTDAVVPIVKYSFPPQRSFYVEEGFVKYQYPEHRLTRSQDLQSIYHDAGQFYCGKTDRLLAQEKLIMDKTVPVILNEQEVQDIDTLEDWELAEIKYQRIYKG